MGVFCIPGKFSKPPRLQKTMYLLAKKYIERGNAKW